MPDLGHRGNVLGPQPIGQPKPAPPEMIAAAELILKLLAEGKGNELAAIATPMGGQEIAQISSVITPGAYNQFEIIAIARVNLHYYVKARLTGPDAKPFTLQFRLGENEGRWIIWEASNLTGRTAWTR
jgi:hypothetical protein